MLARDLARTAQIAPFTASTINPILQDSAKAAASVACADVARCLASWQQGLPDSDEQDQDSTLGSQYSALQIIQQNLVGSGKVLAVQNGTASTLTTGGSASASGNGTASVSASANAGVRSSAAYSGVFVSVLLALALGFQ